MSPLQSCSYSGGSALAAAPEMVPGARSQGPRQDTCLRVSCRCAALRRLFIKDKHYIVKHVAPRPVGGGESLGVSGQQPLAIVGLILIVNRQLPSVERRPSLSSILPVWAGDGGVGCGGVHEARTLRSAWPPGVCIIGVWRVWSVFGGLVCPPPPPLPE